MEIQPYQDDPHAQHGHSEEAPSSETYLQKQLSHSHSAKQSKLIVPLLQTVFDAD